MNSFYVKKSVPHERSLIIILLLHKKICESMVGQQGLCFLSGVPFSTSHTFFLTSSDWMEHKTEQKWQIYDDSDAIVRCDNKEWMQIPGVNWMWWDIFTQSDSKRIQNKLIQCDRTGMAWAQSPLNVSNANGSDARNFDTIRHGEMSVATLEDTIILHFSSSVYPTHPFRRDQWFKMF
jgi:hypothetical protein